ncbi:MAG: BatD family protein [Verrucomicrobia bacterium]|nr:BatD family protein [Verrucomicrobiota bacterium]
MKTLAHTLLLLLLTLGLDAADMPARISVQIAATFQNSPIVGMIAITRTNSQMVDESSFSIDGKPLSVKKIGDSEPAGKAANDADTLILSKYSFEMPAKPRGLYLLSPVKVKVGNSIISSPAVTFEVAGSTSTNELLLEARVVEKGPFYPGQKVTFQYSISFRNPIQLTKEKLPLLEFSGFRTVGAPKIDNLSQGDSTVQLISQQAVAIDPGVFNSGPSNIEGYIFGQDIYGNKVVSQTMIEADAPNVQVTVLPFPKEGMPPSFNGALGVFYWKVRSVGSTNITVGEKITLEVTVSGSGDYDTVHFPDLSLQKGFKDVFRLSDLAPVGEMKDGQKRFTVNMRPIVSGITLIPSIQFSSFDPISKTYVVKQSDPIVITVKPGKRAEIEPPNMDGMPPAVLPIEVQGNIMLGQDNSHARHLQNILLFYTVLFLAAALAAQHLFKRMWLESRAKSGKSRDIILEAIKQKSDPGTCCKLLRKALLLRLYEVGITPTLVEHPEELKTDGLEGDVRTLLLSIEEKRFTGLETQIEIKEIINDATQLYYRMKG